MTTLTQYATIATTTERDIGRLDITILSVAGLMISWALIEWISRR